MIPLDLDPGEQRVAVWTGHAGTRRVALVLTDRRLVTLSAKGVWSQRYDLTASRKLEELGVLRAHDAYGGRRLEIEGSDFSFSDASEDTVREAVLRGRDLRIAAISKQLGGGR